VEHLPSGCVSFAANESEAAVMTLAMRRARAANGPHLGKATIAIAIAAGCLGLLVFLLSPNSGGATSGATATGMNGGHWDGSHDNGNGRVKLIPIVFTDS
jgi:hypothetical protein